MPIEWTMPTAASVDDSHPVARPLAIAYPSEESNAIHFEFRGARFKVRGAGLKMKMPID